MKKTAVGDARSLELMVNAIVDYAIFMLDTEGLVRTWNKGAERLKFYAADEIVGKPFSIFYTPEDREKVCRAERWRQPRRPGASHPKAGESGKMAAGSGRLSFSAASVTRKAAWSVLRR